jgi:hypothetical protein
MDVDLCVAPWQDRPKILALNVASVNVMSAKTESKF